MKKRRLIETSVIRRAMCATCPFRAGSPYEYLRADLEKSACFEASRICHSTGSNAINWRTGIPPMLCRGARDLQLRMFASIGFIAEPSDAAWAERCREMGLEAPITEGNER